MVRMEERTGFSIIFSKEGDGTKIPDEWVFAQNDGIQIVALSLSVFFF